MDNIISGAKTFVALTSPSGDTPAEWRVEDPLIVPMLRPTIRSKATKNAQGTNVNMQLKVSVPVITVVNGVQLSSNTVISTASLTVLQNTIGSEVAFALDSLIAGLQSLRDDYLVGHSA